MIWLIDTCQNNVSADQHHVASSNLKLVEVSCFVFKVWFSIRSKAQARLTRELRFYILKSVHLHMGYNLNS